MDGRRHVLGTNGNVDGGRDRGVQHDGRQDEQAQPAAALDQVAAPARDGLDHGEKHKDHGHEAQRRRQRPVGRDINAEGRRSRADDEQQPPYGVPRRRPEGIVERRAREQPEHDDVSGTQCRYGREPERSRVVGKRTKGVGGRTGGQRGPQPGYRSAAASPQDGDGNEQEERDGAAAQACVETAYQA